MILRAPLGSPAKASATATMGKFVRMWESAYEKSRSRGKHGGKPLPVLRYGPRGFTALARIARVTGAKVAG
jgi:hypothetical protein